MTREESIEILKSSIISEERGKDGKPNGNITCDLTREVFEMAIKALEQTMWIPVSERLPEEGEDVLVWYEYFRWGDYNRMFSTYGIGYQYDGMWSVIQGGMKQNVFAWMPLPQPYKAESEVQDADSN